MVNSRKPTLSKCYRPNHCMAKVDINAPTLPSTALLSVISKIETPSAQGSFMLCLFIGRQLSAGMAQTGTAGISSCRTSCSRVILQISRGPVWFTRIIASQMWRQIGHRSYFFLPPSFYFFFIFLSYNCRSVWSVSTFSISWSNVLKWLLWQMSLISTATLERLSDNCQHPFPVPHPFPSRSLWQKDYKSDWPC